GSDYFRLQAAPPLIGSGPLILNLRRRDNGPGRPRMGNRPVRVVPFPYGTLSLADLLRRREFTSGRCSEHSYVYVGRAVFDQLADSYGANRIHHLDPIAEMGTADVVLDNLRACLEEAVQAAGGGSDALIDHLAQAIHCHIAEVYGGMSFPHGTGKGGLA